MQLTYIFGRPSYRGATGFEVDSGTYVRHVRKSRGLTQKALAKVLGFQVDTIRAWEQGRWSLTPEGQAALIAAFDDTFRPNLAIRAFRSDIHGAIFPGLGARVIRRRLRTNREDFAVSLGVSPRTLRNWERGIPPSGENYRKLIKLLEDSYANRV